MRRRKLTAKQEKFTREYLTNGRNGAAAYRAAYKTKGSDQRAAEEAAKLLKHPKIAPRIAAVVEKAADAVQVDANYVLGNLKEVVERCMQRAPVMVRQGKCMVQAVDEEGRHVWTFNAKGAVAGLTKLGENLALFKMAIEHGGSVAVEVVEELIDADPGPQNGSPAPGAKSVPPK